MSGAHILRDTLASVLAELDRLDPQSLIAARAHGVLADAGGISAPKQRGGWRKKPDKTDREIADLYISGLTAEKVAEKIGCSQGKVYAALRRLSIPRRPPGHGNTPTIATKRSAERLDRIMRMRAEGATLEQIGASEKLTRGRVRQLLNRAGVDTGQRELTADEKAAVADYVGGASLEQAAFKAEMSVSKLRRLIALAGQEVRPAKKKSKRSPETIANAERAAQMYLSGKLIRKIADELALPAPAMVYRLLAVAGVRPSRHRNHPSVEAVS